MLLLQNKHIIAIPLEYGDNQAWQDCRPTSTRLSSHICFRKASVDGLVQAASPAISVNDFLAATRASNNAQSIAFGCWKLG